MGTFSPLPTQIKNENKMLTSFLLGDDITFTVDGLIGSKLETIVCQKALPSPSGAYCCARGPTISVPGLSPPLVVPSSHICSNIKVQNLLGRQSVEAAGQCKLWGISRMEIAGSLVEWFHLYRGGIYMCARSGPQASAWRLLGYIVLWRHCILDVITDWLGSLPDWLGSLREEGSPRKKWCQRISRRRKQSCALLWTRALKGIVKSWWRGADFFKSPFSWKDTIFMQLRSHKETPQKGSVFFSPNNEMDTRRPQSCWKGTEHQLSHIKVTLGILCRLIWKNHCLLISS